MVLRYIACGGFLLLLLPLLMSAGPLRASEPVRVRAGAAELLTFDAAVGTVIVARPEVADVQVASGRKVAVTGRQAGRTTLIVLDQASKVLARRQIVVSHDTTSIQRAVARALPDSKVRVESLDTGIVLSGDVATPQRAQRAVDVAQAMLGSEAQVLNHLETTSPIQVNLRVRVAEMSREVSEALGINWNAMGDLGDAALGLATGRAIGAGGSIPAPSTTDAVGTGSVDVDGSDGSVSAVIDALAERNLVTILAEPNLTAVSGETASFLAGGEFPIPVSQDDGEIDIEFREFGVRLRFTPRILSGNRISLEVRPEVSELSDRGSVTTNGIRVPGLTVQRVSTSIELASGQTFAIAGLLQNVTEQSVRSVPGLSDIPVLGPLFRSARFQSEETELVVVVTPYIVSPADSRQAVRDPLQGFEPAHALDLLLRGQPLDPEHAAEPGRDGSRADEPSRLQPPAGFAY